MDNDEKKLTTAEDMYGNKAATMDKVVAGVDIVTFGGARVAKYIGQGTAKAMKWINRVTDAVTVPATTYRQYKKGR